MSAAAEQYRALEARLREVRAANGDLWSEAEDVILDAMDAPWAAMSDAERAAVEAVPSLTYPGDVRPWVTWFGDYLECPACHAKCGATCPCEPVRPDEKNVTYECAGCGRPRRVTESPS